MSAPTREQVLQLAREAGLQDEFGVSEFAYTYRIEHFANLVAAFSAEKARADYEREHCRHVVHLPDALQALIADAVAAEREACAKVCDEQHDRARTSTGAARADACAVAIRSRGNK